MTIKGSFILEHPHVKAANLFRGVGCNLIEKPKKRRKTSHPKSTAKSCIWETEAHKPITTKFCTSGAVHDVITPAMFVKVG